MEEVEGLRQGEHPRDEVSRRVRREARMKSYNEAGDYHHI